MIYEVIDGCHPCGLTKFMRNSYYWSDIVEFAAENCLNYRSDSELIYMFRYGVTND